MYYFQKSIYLLNFDMHNFIHSKILRNKSLESGSLKSSSKVIIGSDTVWRSMYDFLLAFHSNLYCLETQ